MSGIELSEMTDDLVFDDRPPGKQKSSTAESRSATSSNSKPEESDTFVAAKIRPIQAKTETGIESETLTVDIPQPVAVSPQRKSPAAHAVESLTANKDISKSIDDKPRMATVQQSAVVDAVVKPIPQQSAVVDAVVKPIPQQSALVDAVVDAVVKPIAHQPPLSSSAGAIASPRATVSPVSSDSGGLLQNERKKVNADASNAQRKETLELFETLIASAAKGGASDLLLKRGQVPMFRWNGELFPSRNGPRLESSFLEVLAAVLLSHQHCERLNDLNDVDFSFQSQRGGRIRVNIFHQCGELGLVARLIPTEIPTVEKLDMDVQLKHLVEHKRGLVLVTGATGSGKSTTLAALLDHINSTRTCHVITIEDPIEFVHHDKRSMFNQRELGLDTRSYAAALRSALRQAPDVILVGELRDPETMEVALQAAETGHLVLSTLHTNDAADAILRILGMTSQDKEAVVRAQLADCLRGVISQRLVKRADRNGRIAAQEVMINTATIRERLLKGAHPSVVRDFIAQGFNQGMRTFDQHLIQMVRAGIVDYDEALRNTSNRDDFILRFNGVSDGRQAS